MNNKRKGFVALTMVIIISSLILAFTFTQSIETAHFFDMTERKLYRLMNYYFAYSCIDQAILNTSYDYFFIAPKPILLKNFNCVIDKIEMNGNLRHIYVHGNYKQIKVNREAIIKVYDDRIEIISIT